MRLPVSTAFVLIILSAVTFSACEERKKQESKRIQKGEVQLGGAITVALKEVPVSIDPWSMTSNSAVEIGTHVLEGLVRLGPSSTKIIAGIAESWSVDAAKSAYVFNLDRSVKFHPSSCFGNAAREVTAKDIIYSYEQFVIHADSTLYAATLAGKLKGVGDFRNRSTDKIAGLEAIDDFTLKIQLTKPDESFLYVLAQPSLGIVSKKITEDCTDALPVGTGPFSVASMEPLILKRYSEYHRKDEFGNRYPYLDSLTFIERSNKSEELEAFFNGSIDLVSRLELDPVRGILEQHVADFSGKKPRYIMKREVETASFETYSIYSSRLKHLSDGFMGYRDFTQVQLEQ